MKKKFKEQYQSVDNLEYLTNPMMLGMPTRVSLPSIKTKSPLRKITEKFNRRKYNQKLKQQI